MLLCLCTRIKEPLLAGDKKAKAESDAFCDEEEKVESSARYDDADPIEV